MGLQANVFKYERPTELERAKTVVQFFRSDILNANVQVVREGGENNLHSHPGADGMWMVLAGQARFYTEGDKLVAELNAHEGVHIPRGFPYWFESTGNVPLEVLHVVARTQDAAGPSRVDVAGQKTKGRSQHIDAAKPTVVG